MKNLGFMLVLMIVSPVYAQKNYRGSLGAQIVLGVGGIDYFTDNGKFQDVLIVPKVRFFYSHSFIRAGIEAQVYVSESSGQSLFSLFGALNLLGKRRNVNYFFGPSIQFGAYSPSPIYSYGNTNLTVGLIAQYKALSMGANIGQSYPNYFTGYYQYRHHWYIELGYTFCFRKKSS